MEGEYLLRRYIRVGDWARVRVVATPADRAQVQISADACGWLTEVHGPDAQTRVPRDFEVAAGSGVMYALAQASQQLTATVAMIEFTPADTTPDDVKFATAHAVWRAIGLAPSRPPYIDADGVHFPSAQLPRAVSLS